MPKAMSTSAIFIITASRNTLLACSFICLWLYAKESVVAHGWKKGCNQHVQNSHTNANMQTELHTPGPLLAPDGRLAQVGWSRQPLLDCNLESARFYRWRIKRWD